ncbi:hypothetical protein FPY71_09510 [Aureimonas fodinaquatilis]|uniref:Uncharacterized protein n=1 Tax=Aureimonas fodinaquatilis TaxID=2565783 RepID=A0A5B0DXI0_9HYPH|nr:hypothetical protein [Aureimonas fodinaquatilis]KAA0970712.1 hypothetical protein FPY71_09510 [Aureimonas fodinaquatilis]
MAQKISPLVDIRQCDDRYSLFWDVYELSDLTFEESERALDEICDATFDPKRWRSCHLKIAFLDKEKALRGHAA